MSFSLGRAASATSLCAVLLFSACGGQGNVAAPTAAPSTVSSSATPSPSPSTSEASSTSSPAPQVTETSVAPTPVATTEQPSPSAEPTIAEAAGPAVTAGTDCGPSNTGRTTLVLAEGTASCAEVQQVFADYNAQFDPNNVDANVTIGNYVCNTYTVFGTQVEGRTVSCIGNGNRLEAMSHYLVGGVPVKSSMDYAVHSLTGHFSISASANGVSCGFGEGNILSCTRPSGSQTESYVFNTSNGQLDFQMYDRSWEPPAVPQLGVGQSINTAAGSCLNDGSYLVCSNGTTTIKINGSELIEL